MPPNSKSSITILGSTIYINSKKIPPPPCSARTNIAVIGNKIFINGYEWKDGEWKKTLRALIHLWF